MTKTVKRIISILLTTLALSVLMGLSMLGFWLSKNLSIPSLSDLIVIISIWVLIVASIVAFVVCVCIGISVVYKSIYKALDMKFPTK